VGCSLGEWIICEMTGIVAGDFDQDDVGQEVLLRIKKKKIEMNEGAQRTITGRSTAGMRRPHQSERHRIHPEQWARAMSPSQVVKGVAELVLRAVLSKVSLCG